MKSCGSLSGVVRNHHEFFPITDNDDCQTPKRQTFLSRPQKEIYHKSSNLERCSWILGKIVAFFKYNNRNETYLTEIPIRHSLMKSNLSFLRHETKTVFSSNALMLVYDKNKPFSMSKTAPLQSDNKHLSTKSILTSKDNLLMEHEVTRVVASEEKELTEFLDDLKTIERKRILHYVDFKIFRHNQVQKYYDENDEFF